MCVDGHIHVIYTYMLCLFSFALLTYVSTGIESGVDRIWLDVVGADGFLLTSDFPISTCLSEAVNAGLLNYVDCTSYLFVVPYSHYLSLQWIIWVVGP